MKNLILLMLLVTSFCSYKLSSQEKTRIKSEPKIEKKLFANTESQIKKYHEYSDKNWTQEKAKKYQDSIKNTIISSYIDNYKFQTVDSTFYITSERKKPLFLQVTASWCETCRFEITSLNKIVEKYHNQVDFVLLFWDTQPDLKKLVSKYNKNIFLVPSQKKQDDSLIDIAGFRYIMGFPTDYLITTNNQIINFSTGASTPLTYTQPNGEKIIFTAEEANKYNDEKLENEVKDLLEKNKTIHIN